MLTALRDLFIRSGRAHPYLTVLGVIVLLAGLVVGLIFFAPFLLGVLFGGGVLLVLVWMMGQVVRDVTDDMRTSVEREESVRRESETAERLRIHRETLERKRRGLA